VGLVLEPGHAGRVLPDPAGRARSRAAAIAAGVVTLCGVVLVAQAAAGSRRTFAGYLSELGAASQPYAERFRAGMLLLAAGVALLGTALWPITRLGASLLAVAAVNGVVSGSVSCSDGCPLPPYESFTAADLVHGGASAVAVGFCALATLAVAKAVPQTPLGRTSLVSFGVVAPLVLAVGVAMLTVGGSDVTSVLERVTLTAALAWILLACGLLLLAPASVRVTRAMSADRTPAGGAETSSVEEHP
jgi:Protein of unknown function (DUF998)